jgi:hypothetical protein
VGEGEGELVEIAMGEREVAERAREREGRRGSLTVAERELTRVELRRTTRFAVFEGADDLRLERAGFGLGLGVLLGPAKARDGIE